jgi:hypothetical protein
MTLPLPHTLSSTDNEDGTPSIDRVQENFDELAKQFPIASGNLANDVLKLVVTGTSRKVQFGTLAAVNSDGGGWCNYTLPTAFATAIDAVLAQNTFGGVSGAGFLDVQQTGAGTFRAFVNAAGLNCSCVYIAIGH